MTHALQAIVFVMPIMKEKTVQRRRQKILSCMLQVDKYMCGYLYIVSGGVGIAIGILVGAGVTAGICAYFMSKRRLYEPVKDAHPNP